MSPFCTNCGHEVEESWNVCPECGKFLNETGTPQISQTISSQSQPIPQTAPQPQQVRPYQYRTTQMVKENKYGPPSLILGILGLIFGVYLGIFFTSFGFPIFRVAAIILGGIGISKDENKAMAIVGLILGIIGIVFYFVGGITRLLNIPYL